jgi:hypothetical protein
MSWGSAEQGEGVLRAKGMLAMTTCGRSGGIAPSCLTSSLDGTESSASRPCHFTPGQREPWYKLDRRPGGPQSRSGRCGEEKTLASTGNRPLAVQPVAIPCSY